MTDSLSDCRIWCKFVQQIWFYMEAFNCSQTVPSKEREGEREGERERKREKEGERGRKREREKKNQINKEIIINRTT